METPGATKAWPKGTPKVGYSHSWKITETIPFQPWNAIVQDAKQLVKAYPLIERERPHWLCLSAMHKDQPPRLDVACIRLNGAPSVYEDFVLTPYEKPFAWCKTLHLPHNTIICAILAVAKSHTDLITVWSDGKLED